MLKKFYPSLAKTGLLKKVIVGYIIIIVVPSALIGIFIYNQFYNNMLEDYVKQKQQIFDEYYMSMKNDLLKVQGLSNLYQYNTNVTDYLAYKYKSDLDSIYNYTKFIKPIYDYVYSSVPFIKDMKIYKSNRNVLTIPSTIVNIDTLENAKIINEITSANGIWTCEKNKNTLPQIKYYQKIYNNDFFRGIGIIEIQPKSEVLGTYINNINTILEGHTEILLFGADHKMLYRTGKLHLIPKKTTNTKENLNKLQLLKKTAQPLKLELNGKIITRYIINIKELHIKTVILEDQSFMTRDFKINRGLIILYIIGLFIALSLIYYFFAANITQRILKLAKFMRKVDETNISLYKGKCGNDEIGFLITSYNSMITRIDELVNTVHKEELLRKEAAYAALQAQIRPHFLFGTLESIRMLAETNKDFNVANIIFTFGKLMRYSLTSTKNESSLAEEMENVKNYLLIQKIKMGERLKYDIYIDVNIRQFLCPRFLIQPLVENCIIHGISKNRGQGYVKISAVKHEDCLIIKVIDDGCGILDDRLTTIRNVLANKIDIKNFQTANSGFGIYNVSERLKLYFKGNSRLTLENGNSKGTICTLYLGYKT